MTSQKGFTLIELLVVIAVVGVLAGISLVIINPAGRLEDARDAQRKSGIGQIAVSLTAYYTQSLTSQYPAPTAVNTAEVIVAGSGPGADLVPNHIRTIPEVPQFGGATYQSYFYCTNSTRTEARLYIELERTDTYFLFRTATGTSADTGLGTQPSCEDGGGF